ncbi:unnamed protein product [Fraxinus pennsylvanica]|uniref:F-box domain-containing protein n=1 Tax=Fraxinus pennsylvanica TaxID=56036 RepID=A0AAD1ZGC1_9LAMI|nr:unnamed protein product [Fraxinus pennsylvanica]
MDLPELIILEILLHLSVKGIVMCKCVYKTWQHLISSHHFTKHHFACSKTLHVIESGEQVILKLDTKLKSPLLNVDAQEIAFHEGNTKMKQTINLDTKNHKIIIVNSCNDLL